MTRAAEVSHVKALIRTTDTSLLFSDRGWIVSWRGLRILGGSSQADVYACPALYRDHALERVARVTWAECEPPEEVIVECSWAWIFTAESEGKLSVDRVPWEIHRITDFQAYVAAIEAYREEAA